MQENKKWYWNQKQQKQVIIFPTNTIVHTCIDAEKVKYFHEIPRSICNRNQEIQALQRNVIRLTDSDYNYTFEEI